MGVLGAPQFARRQLSWDELGDISNNLSGDWAIIGDFNSTLSLEESIGGSNSHGHHDAETFRKFFA